MSNSEYIKKHLQKHPFIMKSVLKMDDLDNINVQYIEHFVSMLNTSKEKLKNFKLAYNNYTKFITLYKTMLEISGEKAIDVGFCILEKVEKIEFLETNNIKYKLIDDILAVFPSSFEEGQMIYPKTWCIKSSKKMWDSYNKDSKHLVLFREDKIYGISHNDKTFKCYSKKDIPISYSTFFKEIGKDLPFQLKIDYNKNLNFIEKYYIGTYSITIIITLMISFLYIPTLDFFDENRRDLFASVSLFFCCLSFISIALCLSGYIRHETKVYQSNALIFLSFIFLFPLDYHYENKIKTDKFNEDIKEINEIIGSFYENTNKTEPEPIVIAPKIISPEDIALYQKELLKEIKTGKTSNMSEIKNFLITGEHPPIEFYNIVLIKSIQDNDYNKFTSTIEEIDNKKLDIESALEEAVTLDRENFVQNLLDISDSSTHFLSTLIRISMYNHNKEIFKILVHQKNFSLDDFYFLSMSLNDEIEEYFYTYMLNNINFTYKKIFIESMEQSNFILINLLLEKEHMQKNTDANFLLETALSITDSIQRDNLVEMMFNKTDFDYNLYSETIITTAIILDYDYIINDFIDNIDKIKNINNDDILKLLSITEHNEALDRLKKYMGKI
jgi:hypothetical protein